MVSRSIISARQFLWFYSPPVEIRSQSRRGAWSFQQENQFVYGTRVLELVTLGISLKIDVFYEDSQCLSLMFLSLPSRSGHNRRSSKDTTGILSRGSASGPTHDHELIYNYYTESTEFGVPLPAAGPTATRVVHCSVDTPPGLSKIMSFERYISLLLSKNIDLVSKEEFFGKPQLKDWSKKKTFDQHISLAIARSANIELDLKDHVLQDHEDEVEKKDPRNLPGYEEDIIGSEI